MHKEFADVVQAITEKQGEVGPEQIMSEFRRCYLNKKEPYHFRKSRIEEVSSEAGDYDTRLRWICAFLTTMNMPCRKAQQRRRRPIFT